MPAAHAPTGATPAPGPGEVVTQMKAAGLCGSDLHMFYRPTPQERRGEIRDQGPEPGRHRAGATSPGECGRRRVVLSIPCRQRVCRQCAKPSGCCGT
ncbi:hypothetical protein E2651_22065 [Streptomyces sp. MZ04]|nr:hypothetical protein E2651_22065 [Streptomyces sp. MZ04]